MELPNYNCMTEAPHRINSLEQRPSWEVNSHSASQEILLLCSPEVHYRVHKSPPLVPILIQMLSGHAFPNCFPNIRFNIIFPSTPRSSERSIAFRFSNHNFLCISHIFHPCYIHLLFHPPLLHNPRNIWWIVHVVKLLIMQSSPISRHSISLRSEHSPRHPVLKHPRTVFFPWWDRQGFIQNNR